MKVSVLGAGAVGCMVGGLIRHHDPSVELWLLGRGEHAEQMRRSGHVELRGHWGVHRVPVHVCDDVRDVADSDYLLLTVKSHSTRPMMESVQPYLGDGVVISLQNGINQHALAEFMPADKYLVGMTAANSALLEPGVVSLQHNGVTIVGSCGGADRQAVADAVNVLSKSKLSMSSSEHIEGVQYNKIAINSIGYASVLSRSNFLSEGILHGPWRQTVAEPLLDECFEVYRQAGLKLQPVPGPSDAHRFRRLLNWLDWSLPRKAMAPVIRRKAQQRIVYSVEQDLLRGNSTEIDFVNGEIVRLARTHNIRAPLNELTVDMVGELEKREPGEFFSREEVIKRMEGVA